MDSGKVKTIVGLTSGAVALFLLYKLLTRGKAETSFTASTNPFVGRIDPRSPLDIKQKEALDIVKDFMAHTFKG